MENIVYTCKFFYRVLTKTDERSGEGDTGNK